MDLCGEEGSLVEGSLVEDSLEEEEEEECFLTFGEDISGTSEIFSFWYLAKATSYFALASMAWSLNGYGARSKRKQNKKRVH